MMKSRARRFHSACLMACQSEWSPAPAVAAPQATSGLPAQSQMFDGAIAKMHNKSNRRPVRIVEVTDVTRENETDAIDMGEVGVMMGRFRRFRLKYREPKLVEDPTTEQLSMLENLRKPPSPTAYVGFFMWGPHGTRTQGAMKFEGLLLALDGTLVRKQTRGPPDFITWKSYFVVFAIAMVMLDQCIPPELDANMELIVKFVARYGHSCSSIRRRLA